MGSVIPIKVAEGRSFSEKLKNQRNISSHKSQKKCFQGNTEDVQHEKTSIIF